MREDEVRGPELRPGGLGRPRWRERGKAVVATVDVDHEDGSGVRTRRRSASALQAHGELLLVQRRALRRLQDRAAVQMRLVGHELVG